MAEYTLRGDVNIPFFSIIIPAYNVDEVYFTQCIESLLHQTFQDLEILIVDDGSTEECRNFYENLSNDDHRIKVIHQNNQGVSAARNNGIKNANADWIMFVDSDDWLELVCCEKLHESLITNNVDLLLFNHIKEYKSGKQLKQGIGLQQGTVFSTEDIEVKERLYRRAMGTPNIDNASLSTIYYSWDKVYSRDFLLCNEINFPVGLPKSEDKVFILRCFEKLHSFLYIDEAFYHYRINEQSVSNKYSQNVDEERRLLAKYLEPIAKRMDSEIGGLTNTPDYKKIYKDYNRFVFGIISDVLFSKYYHNDYPGSKKERNKEVAAFLESEPFRSAIYTCNYRELGTEAKVKKFMLTHGMTSLFCSIRKLKRRAAGQVG